MKTEIYSCLKMLESLYNRTINAHNIGRWEGAYYLGKEYIRIWFLLKKYLPENQFEFISPLKEENFSANYFGNGLELAQKAYITSVATACDISLSFLKSLEMNLDKELAKQKMEMQLKEKELDIKEKENEYMQKLLNKSLEAIKEFPEYQRSKFVEETKKSHREIEKNTNPDSKSQNN